MTLPLLHRALPALGLAFFLGLMALPTVASAAAPPPELPMAPIVRDEPQRPAGLLVPTERDFTPPLRRGPLLLAGDTPPPPPPPPPPPSPPIQPKIPWTSGNGSMVWSPAVAFGPSFIVTPDFVAAGFDISVGVHHFIEYDPNPITYSTAARVASLGILALPKGALLGNEHGLEMVSRLYFLPHDRTLIETALRPVSRVLMAGSRLSLPSVIGALLPAVGVASLSKDKPSPSAGTSREQSAFLSRWSLNARLILLEKPVLLFLELDPFAELLAPFAGGPPHVAYGANLNFGFNIMER